MQCDLVHSDCWTKDGIWEVTGGSWASQVALAVRNLPADAGDSRDPGLTPGSERLPGGGHDNPLQYFCWTIPWTEESGRL